MKQDEVEGLLQPKLNLKVSQRQVLTPGLVQMVSVLALNKLELREMINTEMVENPVLEEIEESVVSIEEMAGREGDRERSAEEVVAEQERVEKDPFDEVDFGSYFQDYLDPGFRTASNFEDIERPVVREFPLAAQHADRPPGLAAWVDESCGRKCGWRRTWS